MVDATAPPPSRNSSQGIWSPFLLQYHSTDFDLGHRFHCRMFHFIKTPEWSLYVNKFYQWENNVQKRKTIKIQVYKLNFSSSLKWIKFLCALNLPIIFFSIYIILTLSKCSSVTVLLNLFLMNFRAEKQRKPVLWKVWE